MTASKGFPAEDLLQMLLERLQVTLGLKNPCNLCGAFSDLGSVGHDRVSHPTKAARSRQLRWTRPLFLGRSWHALTRHKSPAFCLGSCFEFLQMGLGQIRLFQLAIEFSQEKMNLGIAGAELWQSHG